MSTTNFSFENRPHFLSQLQTELFDILIVGGGITGAGLARDAALRGLKVALIEKNDFASATSSGSSKLIHGGVRYLQNFEFGLVSEAVKERELLKKLYAPFVRDLEFVFPTYKKKKPPRWQLNLGLTLYDSFSLFKVRHENLSRQQTIETYPLLEKQGLTGCCVYNDSFAEDYRLVVELAKSAHRHGACLVSQVEAKAFDSLETGETKTQVEDRLSGESFQIKSKTVVNCSGPFSDSIRSLLGLKNTLRLTQGVHFVTPREKLPIRKAFVLTDNELDRIVFAIPWNHTTYLGTTDTSIDRPQDARATKEDVDYILKITNQGFDVGLEPSDIIQSWAAVRPLIAPEDARSNSKVSREHEILEEPKNIFHILGGKITSHRAMAEDAMKALRHRLDIPKSQTATAPLQEKLWQKEPENHLEATYGYDATKVKELGDRPLLTGLPYLEGEVHFAIDHEMALTPVDYMRRRSSIYYEAPRWEIFDRVLGIFRERMPVTDKDADRFRKEFEKELEWDQGAFR